MIHVMTILVFGDSIAYGYSDSQGGWVDRLRVENFKADSPHDIYNLGISGATSESLLKQITNEIDARRWFDEIHVIVAIGLNDSMLVGEKPQTSESAFRTNIENLIGLLKDNCRSFEFMGLTACDEKRTLPVGWGDFHFKNERIKNYENIIGEVTASQNVPFTPLFDKFQGKPELLEDGLHPNSEGHELILDSIKTGSKLLS